MDVVRGDAMERWGSNTLDSPRNFYVRRKEEKMSVGGKAERMKMEMGQGQGRRRRERQG